MDKSNESKIKQIFTKFKELWKDKRYRSLMILLLYFIFFLFIFIFLNVNSNENNNKDTQRILFKNYKVYEFTTNININDYIFEIDGKRYNNNYSFSFNDEVFNLNYAEIMESNLDKNIINSFNFTPDIIDNIIKNSSLISEKKVISNNEIIKEYNILLSDYLNILDFNLVNYDNSDFVLIEVTELNKDVVFVKLDLTNFYKNIEESYFKYEITQDIATCLITGIITDTGGFKYEGVTSETFEIASEFLDKGVKISKIYNGNSNTNSRHINIKQYM